MKIKHLSNTALDESLKDLASKERTLLKTVLEHIAEADRRRLYLEYSYPSLFEYMTQHLRYSAGSAQRRIDAARMIREFPSIKYDIQNGLLNMAQISLLQKTFRQAQKTHKLVDASGKILSQTEAQNIKKK